MIDETYLIILSAVVVILFIALMVLSYKVFTLQNTISTTQKPDIHEAKRTELPKVQEANETISPEITTEPTRTIIPDINLTEGTSDMNESMKRYTQKYHLDSATLASTDGFSLASSHANSEKEAANLTAIYRENKITEIGETHIIPIDYKGEEILILFRTKDNTNQEQADMMRRDGGIILSNWL